MPIQFARREFLAGMVAMTAAKAASRFAANDAGSPFRVSVINDEISQDFGHACEVASREFGMNWIELRGMWKKNIVSLDEKEVAEARRILEKFQLKVTDIASPLFKVDWPGAPKSKFSAHGPRPGRPRSRRLRVRDSRFSRRLRHAIAQPVRRLRRAQRHHRHYPSLSSAIAGEPGRVAQGAGGAGGHVAATRSLVQPGRDDPAVLSPRRSGQAVAAPPLPPFPADVPGMGPPDADAAGRCRRHPGYAPRGQFTFHFEHRRLETSVRSWWTDW